MEDGDINNVEVDDDDDDADGEDIDNSFLVVLVVLVTVVVSGSIVGIIDFVVWPGKAICFVPKFIDNPLS